MGRILDAIFGKRYVVGWPRGVKPVVTGLDRIKRENPEVWEEIRQEPCGVGLARLRELGLL